MSKFNLKTSNKTVNRAGGEAYIQSDELSFISLLLTSFCKEQFYRSEENTNENIKENDENTNETNKNNTNINNTNTFNINANNISPENKNKISHLEKFAQPIFQIVCHTAVLFSWSTAGRNSNESLALYVANREMFFSECIEAIQKSFYGAGYVSHIDRRRKNNRVCSNDLACNFVEVIIVNT